MAWACFKERRDRGGKNILMRIYVEGKRRRGKPKNGYVNKM